MTARELLIQGAWAAAGLLVVGMVLAFIRLVRGPSLPDRVVAFDAMAVMSTGALGLAAIATDEPLLIDVTLVAALITFLGVVALAFAFERGRGGE